MEGGIYFDWREGKSGTWQAKKHKTPHEKVAFDERVTAARAEAKRQEEEKRTRCRKRSEDIWSNGYSADQHPYLLKKNVKAHGVKQLDGELWIPVRDSNGTLHGLQKINPDGDKRFEPATAVKGHFHQIGIPREEILIAEGYATAATIHEVTGLAAVCGFNAGNLKPVALEIRKKYPGVKITFCVDDDLVTDGNPGLTKASEAAKAVGGYLAIPMFSEGRKQKDSDFNDMLKISGPEAVKACIEAATRPVEETASYSEDQSREETVTPSAWPEPIPFDDYSLLPEFPIEAIPGVCGEIIHRLAESCQVDAGLPGTQMLAVLSTAIGARSKIVLDTHTEPGNLYLFSQCGSGNRKSETNKQLTFPLYSYQKTQQEAMVSVIREAENKARILERRLEKLEKRAADEDDPLERDSIIRECNSILREIEENPVPATPTYLVDDITPEKLGGIMADNGERIAILSPEGGIFKIISGLYSKGHTPNIDLILKAHAGDAWSSHRVGRESKTMERPALTLGLMVQPDVLEEIGKNSEFRSRGLSARFLYSICLSHAGYRTRHTSPIPANIKEAFHRLIESLVAIEGKHELRLSPDAQSLWNEFYDETEKLLRSGAELEFLVDWGSKLPGAVARISGLLHFAEHGPQGTEKPISRDSMSRACLLGVYFTEHAKAAFSIMKEDNRLPVARKILSYINRCRPERFKGRDLFSHTNITSMEEMQMGMTILIQRGYVREAGKVDPIRKPGRPESVIYEVNQKIFSKV